MWGNPVPERKGSLRGEKRKTFKEQWKFLKKVLKCNNEKVNLYDN